MRPDKKKRFQSKTPREGSDIPPEVKDQLARIQEAIRRSTIPLFSQEGTKVVVFGSAVLVAVGSFRFLLTAAHVPHRARAANQAIAFMYPDGTYQACDGDEGFFITASEDPSHMDDGEDLGIYRLSDAMATKLASHYAFVTLDQFEPAEHLTPHESGYTTVGFPNALSPEDVQKAGFTGMTLATVKYKGRARKLGPFDGDRQLAFEYRAEYSMGASGKLETMKLPNPGGMSGGAIWRTFDGSKKTEEQSVDLLRLVGIVQLRVKDPPVIVGTQIEYAFRLLIARYPELAAVLNAYLPGWKKHGWKPRV
jgi:hypothetical protein